MFGFISRTQKIETLEARVEGLTNSLSLLQAQAKDIADTATRRWEHSVAEFTRVPDAQIIALSHVDAPNVKIDFPIREVVQALADKNSLGVLPESAAEIVVLNTGHDT